MKYKAYVILFIAITIIILLFVNLNHKTKPKIAAIKINDIIITLEVADDYLEQINGLSNRKNLDDYHGMLFVYPRYQAMNFWMKEMNFPIDVIWIKDNEIVGFEENIPLFNEQGEIKKFSSLIPVNYVLEVPANFIDKNNIKITDKIELIYEK